MNQQQRFRRVLFTLLTIFLITSSIFTAAAAAKEEVVYANLDESGDTEGVYVVNIFGYDKLAGAVEKDPEHPTIVDYGNYTSVKNLVTTEPVLKTGHDEYTIYINPNLPPDSKLYYQGNTNTPIPWAIKVTYFLDGKQVTPEEIAGKAGHVTVTINITANKEYGLDNFFYKNYALTATVLLDANTCLNIVSKDATIANNGAKKQLTYTILPNRNTAIVIDTDSVDFTMGEISINGVRLSMNINTDSINMSDVDDLKDGVRKLADSAAAVTALAASHYAKAVYLPSGGLNDSIRAEAVKIAAFTNELYNNLLKLKNKTSDMETKITDKVNEVLDPLGKNPQSLKSFSSDKNSDVERVQFVIHTREVKVKEAEPVAKPPEKEKSFLDRLIALFTGKK